MRATYGAIGVVLLLAACDSARGDCLLRRLPPDGSWATFHCSEEFDEGTTRNTYITIKSVGKAAVDGTDCRWIELKYQSDESRTAGKGYVIKFLIPEKHIGPDRDPLKHVIKSWRKNLDEELDELEKEKVVEQYPRLYLVISEPIKITKKREEKGFVEWQKGRLECDVLEGTSRRELKVENCDLEYRLSVNEKVPFGVAGVTMRLESSLGYKGTIEYRLVDMGTDATSDLPDAK
jgi:hypothetical protein